jgi:two-component system sensor histidine kinase PhoQ
MLGNLLDNACKAAKSNVLLSIYKENEHLVICVEDDGSGIASAQKSLILERGKRADTYSQGHGIGLAIVQDLVFSYEGALDIGKSETLGGAKFTIRFRQS